ncbi:MAG: diaminopimelate decarboxylase [Ignavibacteriales bacterium]|nr:diaminopimelate decarboxylase [Ignavibacteriales bacterium]
MRYFLYKENELLCEDIPILELVEEYGTPLYLYSRNQIVENYKSIDSAFGSTDHVTCYALKANSNLHILKLLAEEGAGADVVSAGELFLALKAGFPPEKIAFAGVGKREDEIEYALAQKVFSLNAESHQELQLISRVALRLNTTARVSLRINPDIDAQSHPYITTGLHSNKFGIDSSQALDAFRYALSLPSVEVIGLHTHIGSQITKTEPFIETAKFVVQFLAKLHESGVRISHIDFGGGFGVQYANAIRHEALHVEDHGSGSVTSPAEFVASVLPILQETGCSVWLEPGRSVVADAGILVTKVLYTKENGNKKFVVTDAGMTDLLRPSLYNAHHQIVPVRIETYESEKVDIVGPICETGDFLARDRMLTKVKPNDVLAVLTAGAYGFVNTSHYNARPRPAEILVNGDRVRVIRQRETFEDLV